MVFKGPTYRRFFGGMGWLCMLLDFGFQENNGPMLTRGRAIILGHWAIIIQAKSYKNGEVNLAQS